MKKKKGKKVQKSSSPAFQFFEQNKQLRKAQHFANALNYIMSSVRRNSETHPRMWDFALADISQSPAYSAATILHKQEEVATALAQQPQVVRDLYWSLYSDLRLRLSSTLQQLQIEADKLQELKAILMVLTYDLYWPYLLQCLQVHFTSIYLDLPKVTINHGDGKKKKKKNKQQGQQQQEQQSAAQSIIATSESEPTAPVAEALAASLAADAAVPVGAAADASASASASASSSVSASASGDAAASKDKAPDPLALSWQQFVAKHDGCRGYAHFDQRVSLSTPWVQRLICDPEQVAKHGFMPLIHRPITAKKLVSNGATASSSAAAGNFVEDAQEAAYSGLTFEVKTRDIYYSSHLDRCIYQRYAWQLNTLYTQYMHAQSWGRSVLAYRSDLGGWSNIDMAHEAFAYIAAQSESVVVVADFSHFFDSLDHAYLKERLCALLGVERLPADYFAIYKNVTRYVSCEWQDIKDLHFKMRENWQEARRFVVDSSLEQYSPANWYKLGYQRWMQFMRMVLCFNPQVLGREDTFESFFPTLTQAFLQDRAPFFCYAVSNKPEANKISAYVVEMPQLSFGHNSSFATDKDINSCDRVLPLSTFKEQKSEEGFLKVNRQGVGIPQGLPVSAVLSNIYMTEFDAQLGSWVESVGGFYRRYCDDLIVVLPRGQQSTAQWGQQVAALAQKLQGVGAAVPGVTLNEHKCHVWQVQAQKVTELPSLQVAASQLSNEAAPSVPLVPPVPPVASEVRFLGFCFNGKTARIRPAAIQSYHRHLRHKAQNIVQRDWISPEDRHITAHNLYRLYGNDPRDANFASYIRRLQAVFGEMLHDPEALAIVQHAKHHIAMLFKHLMQEQRKQLWQRVNHEDKLSRGKKWQQRLMEHHTKSKVRKLFAGQEPHDEHERQMLLEMLEELRSGQQQSQQPQQPQQ